LKNPTSNARPATMASDDLSSPSRGHPETRLLAAASRSTSQDAVEKTHGRPRRRLTRPSTALLARRSGRPRIRACLGSQGTLWGRLNAWPTVRPRTESWRRPGPGTTWEAEPAPQLTTAAKLTGEPMAAAKEAAAEPREPRHQPAAKRLMVLLTRPRYSRPMKQPRGQPQAPSETRSWAATNLKTPLGTHWERLTRRWVAPGKK
jgi:hypothetical protein